MEEIEVRPEVVALCREIAGHILIAKESLSMAKSQLSLAEEKLMAIVSGQK